MFLSRKCANTRSTKALRDNFALAESQPTSGTLQLSFSWRSTLHPVYQSFLVLNFGTGTHAVSEVSFILEEFEFCRRSWILFDCRHFMGGMSMTQLRRGHLAARLRESGEKGFCNQLNLAFDRQK